MSPEPLTIIPGQAESVDINGFSLGLQVLPTITVLSTTTTDGSFLDLSDFLSDDDD